MSRLFLHLGLAGKALLAGLMAAAWTALVLADFGRFRASLCLLAAALAAALAYALAWWNAQEETEPTQAGSLALALAILLAAGTLAYSLPPSETVLGGWDPGVYIHTAAAVARGGSLRIDDPDLAGLSDREKSVVSRNLFGVSEPFGGMRVLPSGRTSPEFHHLYPCLMAVPFAVGGVRAALALNPILNAVAVVLLFLLARNLVGQAGGLLAALCFAIFPAQAWQSGFSTSEPLTQVLLLAAFLFLGPALEGRSWLDAVLCGAAFGLALLARYDTVLLLVPMAFVLVVAWRRELSPAHALVAAGVFAAALVHLYFHQRYVAPYYAPLNDVVRMALVVSAALLAAWLALAWSPLRARDVASAHARAIRIAATTGFIAWVFFAWFVRPRLDLPGAASHFLGSMLPKAFWEKLAGDNAHNIDMFVGMMGSTGLALAFIGIAVWLMRLEGTARLAWLYGSVAVLALLVTSVFNDHFMMWVTRRFVPVVVPLLAVAIAAGLKAVCDKIAERNGLAAIIVTVPLAALVLIGLWMPFRAVTSARDWPGLVTWFRGVQAAVPDDAWIYCDQPGFAAPLRYLYGKHAFQLQLKSDDGRARLADVMASKIDQGRDVWLLTMAGPLRHPAFVCEPVREFLLNTHERNSQNYAVPSGVRPRGGDFLLYRLRASGTAD